jgi:hypothetical protein
LPRWANRQPPARAAPSLVRALRDRARGPPVRYRDKPAPTPERDPLHADRQATEKKRPQVEKILLPPAMRLKNKKRPFRSEQKTGNNQTTTRQETPIQVCKLSVPDEGYRSGRSSLAKNARLLDPGHQARVRPNSLTFEVHAAFAQGPRSPASGRLQSKDRSGPASSTLSRRRWRKAAQFRTGLKLGPEGVTERALGACSVEAIIRPNVANIVLSSTDFKNSAARVRKSPQNSV